MAGNTKGHFVVDASFVLAFLFPDEYRPKVDQIFNQFKANSINLSSTHLLPFEVTNGLKMAILRKRITYEYSIERTREFLNYQIESKEVDFLEIFFLAQKHDLTVYDASYLYLALQENVPLLTLDNKLSKIRLATQG